MVPLGITLALAGLFGFLQARNRPPSSTLIFDMNPAEQTEVSIYVMVAGGVLVLMGLLFRTGR
jgi:hypothetical protein